MPSRPFFANVAKTVGPIETRKLELSPTFQFDSVNTEGAVEVCGETPPAEDDKGKRETGQENGCDSQEPGEYSLCPVLRDARTIAERHTCAIEALEPYTCTLSRARQGILCFSLDKRLTWMAGFELTLYGRIWVPLKVGQSWVQQSLLRPRLLLSGCTALEGGCL